MKTGMRHALALFVLVAACTGGKETETKLNESAPNNAVAAVRAPAAPKVGSQVKSPPDAGGEKPDDTDESRLKMLRSQTAVGVRLISGRTLSMKFKFENGEKAVFKPMLKNDSRAPREVAVYRLAKLLDIEVVPISTMRTVPLGRILELLRAGNQTEAEELGANADADDKGNLPGAVIEWIHGLNQKGFEELGGRLAIKKWLSPGSPLKTIPEIAAGASAMIVFDYLVGNWDRFSGGNIFVAPDGGRFVLLDHNGSLAQWNERQKERMDRSLADTYRFPKSLVARLRDLDPGQISRAMEKEPWNQAHPLITTEQIELLLSRRDEIVAHVDRLIQSSGKDAVLAFK